uniref:ATP synthase subunit 8 n=1 Tax=Takecallis arundinariae TaxID=691750 RepID=A0A1L1YLZ6_9HEMI|nr:ATP synthase subunit 8 [Takecallis arundinariae]
MAPINWLMLFIIFFITFLITSNLIYFTYIKNMKINFKKKNLTKNYNKLI